MSYGLGRRHLKAECTASHCQGGEGMESIPGYGKNIWKFQRWESTEAIRLTRGQCRQVQRRRVESGISED